MNLELVMRRAGVYMGAVERMLGVGRGTVFDMEGGMKGLHEMALGKSGGGGKTGNRGKRRSARATAPVLPKGRDPRGASRADDTRSMREEARRHDG
ncbi:MAG: hypothetical protein HPY75_07295 [Actinobacteria bacterium]|nr:hypothetical protein [Actinomycetota bacterium]